MAQALFQSTGSHRLVDILLRDNVEVMGDALAVAESRGELLTGTDIGATARRLVAAQWGSVMMWQKGLLELQAVPAELLAGQVAILQSVCEPSRRRWL